MTDVAPSVRELYVWDHARLWRALVVASGSEQAAHDTIVEVFAAVLRRVPAGQDATDLVWRSAFRIARETDVARPDLGAVGDVDEIGAVVARIATLGADDRTLFAWRHVAGWSLDELAPALRLSKRALGRRLGVVEERARRAGVFDAGDPATVLGQLAVPDVWDDIVAAAEELPAEQPRRRLWRR